MIRLLTITFRYGQKEAGLSGGSAAHSAMLTATDHHQHAQRRDSDGGDHLIQPGRQDQQGPRLLHDAGQARPVHPRRLRRQQAQKHRRPVVPPLPGASEGKARLSTDGGPMSVVTLEAIIEDGQIRLPSNIRLPERTKVFVVIPGVEVERTGRIASPRLARPEQAADFVMEVTEAESDAGV